MALLVAAFLFGASFVTVKSALDDIGPLGFVGWRFGLGALILAAIGLPRTRAIWRDGALAGLALFAGYALQTGGLVFTSASNSALITGLYVVFTPFIVMFFSRRLPSPWVIAGAALAFAGVILLTGVEDFSFQTGDLLTFGCAIAFAVHIVLLSRTARRHPIVPFTAVQLAVTSTLAFGAALAFESVSVPGGDVWPEIIITAVGVSVVAFMLQVWSQRVLGASTAAIILTGEPAFAVATAWLVLDERLTTGGWVGAALITVAMMVVVSKQRDDASRAAEAVSAGH